MFIHTPIILQCGFHCTFFLCGVAYTVKPTTQFKKDYKLAMKRGLNMTLLDDIVALLANGEILPEKNQDHALTGNWTGHRECHIQPDWLLLYRMEADVLVLTLTRTGSHSDLFDK